MPWWAWILIVIVALWVVGSFTDNEEPKAVSGRKKGGRRGESHKSPREIADAVATYKQFRGLERRLDRAEEAIGSGATEAAYDKAVARQEALQEALDLAASKTYRRQFLPLMELETPLSTLESAFEVFQEADYRAKRAELGGADDEWVELRGWDEPEEKEPVLKPLKKFREVVESDLTRAKAVRQINSVCSHYKDFTEEFFDTGDELDPGDQWFASKMAEDGLPMAYELYLRGYTSPEKCLEIDLEDFGNQKGVGPKRVEQMKAYQAKVRTQIAPREGA